MSSHSYYKLSVPSLYEYYNIMGLDLNLINNASVETEVRDLEELRPDIAYEVLPESSIEVASLYEEIIRKLCSDFGYSEEEINLKTKYYNSVIGILNTVTSLNLIPEISEDYLLNFHRVNSILQLVLREINNAQVEEVITFANFLGEGKARELSRISNALRYTPLFAILALNSNNDIPDYEMFVSDESSQIDVEKLLSLVKNNLNSKYEKHKLRIVFNRPSYLKCYQSAPKNK